ncbi:transcriptional regulator domain-containing protein [Pseudodesulfovibrio indicus]|uniref:transcriptional regulator domain-containing protein n=1 Tax=Pseudodesulfovibrio indicus TaxID=1716143 RepID=UPI00292F40E4|nr:hypothetical protein [Pseudodesulfovibrio indicus]
MYIRNWENEDEYIFPEDYPPRRWAWEFLRRSPAYQSCWEEALQSLPKSSTRYVRPEAHDFIIEDVRAYEFGLATGLLNPMTDSPLFLSFIPDGEPRMITGTGGEMVGPLPPYSAVAVFDIQRPIAPQIQDVKERLLQMQMADNDLFENGFVSGHDVSPTAVSVESHRDRKSNWPLYLRVLDAKLACVPNSVSGPTLFEHYSNEYPEYRMTKHMSRITRQAMDMANHNYRFINK